MHILYIVGIIIAIILLVTLVVYLCLKNKRKYFHEVKGYPHLDSKYGKKSLTQKDINLSLIKLYKEFFNYCEKRKIKPVLMYGGLIGYNFNKKLLPWDDDIDMILFDSDLDKLEKYSSNTMLVDINPNIRNKSTSDTNNLIGARAISKQTGVFIDITYFWEDGDELKCKDKNSFKYVDIFPLKKDLFEGTPTFVPNNIDNVLIKKYGKQSLNPFQGDWSFDYDSKSWKKGNDKIQHTPKDVYMTYYDLDKIPGYVLENIYRYCKGFKIHIYNDDMCKQFLLEYYGERAVEIFKSFKKGAHKADFWRYCILYSFGGYYFDIKTYFQKPIKNIFTENGNTMYMVICDGDSCIYNGIIVTPPNNPILYKEIRYMFKNNKPRIYREYVNHLLETLQNEGASKLGENKLKNSWNCVLFKEYCKRCDASEKCDRYNLDCKIKDNNGSILFNTRYKDFPW